MKINTFDKVSSEKQLCVWIFLWEHNNHFGA